MKRKKFKFICPNCGSSNLCLEGKFTYILKFPVEEVSWEPVTMTHLIDLDMKNRYLLNVKDAHCYCRGCGLEAVSQNDILDSNYDYLGDELVEWIREKGMEIVENE
jgi:hypothetical protein